MMRRVDLTTTESPCQWENIITSRGENSFKLIFNAICKHFQMPDDSYNGSSVLKRSPACALNTHTVLLCEIHLTNMI